MKKIALAFVFFSLLLSFRIFAQEQVDPLEGQAQKIDRELIAPCCWTATLDEHFSDVALDMKSQIRQMLSEGKSEKQILSFFEAKYGERVLSEPKKAGFNMTVWIFPFVILGVGLSLLFYVLSKRKKLDEPTHVTTIVPLNLESDEKYRKIINDELYRS